MVKPAYDPITTARLQYSEFVMDIATDLRTTGTQEIVSAMADGRVTYLTQPVESIARAGRELYRECLARMIDVDGCVQSPVSFIPELEAHGKIGLLDAHMIELAMGHLAQTENLVLGCNLSADTIQAEATWKTIVSQIRARPDLAPRLVLEITETRPVVAFDTLTAHITEARAAGCRVAIDDFGAGFLSPADLLKLKADIIKIDASLLRTIRHRRNGTSTFQHIVGFALCNAPIVVIEGVEEAEDVEISSEAGATHMQGYFIARPVLNRLQRSGQNTSLHS